MREARLPSPAARSAAPAWRERGTARARRERARRASRGGRAGSASAQWMSSNRSSVGPSAASDSTRMRAEKNSVSRSPTSPSSPRPMSSARCAACSAAASAPTISTTAASSLARASGSSSLSYTRAICFTCWAKAPYGLDEPYGSRSSRGVRGRPATPTCSMSSSERRDLPIPAGPKTVTRWGRPSATTRSQIPVSTSS